MIVAPIVHVRDELAGICRPAIVLGLPYTSDEQIQARVLYPSGATNSLGGAVGVEDQEGLFAPTAHPTYVDNPDGYTRRALDHWHIAEGCQYRP